MRNLSEGLTSGLRAQYGSNPQIVVAFRERKYGAYDAGDEVYRVSMPTMEGRLTSVNGFRFSVNSGSNTVACDVSFEICDTTEAILSDVLNLEFTKLDACKIGYTCAGHTSIEYIFQGFLSDPITWDMDKKSFTATFTSDYSKKKIGYVFKGTEVAYPNKALKGQALPTVFGNVAQAKCMQVQTGCVGNLSDDFSFVYGTTYPEIIPQEIRLTNINVPDSLRTATGIELAAATKFQVYIGGAVLEVAYLYDKPHTLQVTKVWLEVSEQLKLPKISINAFSTNGQAAVMPAIEGGGWFVEHMYIGLEFADSSKKTLMAGALGWDLVAEKFIGINFITQQLKHLIHFHDKWLDPVGKLLLKASDILLSSDEAPVKYLSVLPPDEVVRISNGVYQRPAGKVVDPRSEYKDIQTAYRTAIEIDNETKNVRIESGTPVVLIDTATKAFVPDILVANHSIIPADTSVYTGIGSESATITTAMGELYYELHNENVDGLRLIKQKYYKDETVSDYPIVMGDRTTFSAVGGEVVEATTITLAVPAVLFGGSDIYVDIQSNITSNTARQIQRILNMETAYAFDTSTFDAAAVECNNFPSCFVLDNTRGKAGAIKVSSELAYLGNLGLIVCAPLIKLKYLVLEKDADATIDRSCVIAGRYQTQFTSPQDTITLYRGQYALSDYGWNGDKTIFTIIKQCGTGLEVQNETEIPYYIYNNAANVQKSLDYISLQTGYTWAHLKVTLPAWAIKFEVFDYVNVELPDIEDGKGVVEAIEYDANECLVSLSIKMALVSGD